MNIKGIEIDESTIYNAYGTWIKDTRCIIAIELFGREWDPLIFVARTVEEANAMQPLLNQAVDAHLRNRR